MRTLLPCGLLLLASLAMVARAPAEDAAADHFEQVATIFERQCVGCHRGVAARAGLRLDTRGGLLRGGDSGPAIVAGDAAQSLLVEMISGDEPAMPAEAPPLGAEQVALVRRWIDAGAEWPADRALQDKSEGGLWWSLAPLNAPAVPTFDDEFARQWVRTPIDAFVLAKLREKGLEPSPAAEPGTLLRRVSFDLVGLPPEPAELPPGELTDLEGWYQQQIERLLAAPQYGERWARHWLDVVHFGETHGYDKDKRRDHAWRYRDWVIEALNADLPYADFVRDQLAGDVLHPGDPRGVIALGFIAAGPWDFVGHVELREGTVEKMRTRAIDRDDMVANAMSTFTSLTVHCARCHDHAFDPISQRDYYRLQAVFAGVDRADREIPDPGLTERRHELAALRERWETQRQALLAPRPWFAEELADLDARLAALRGQLAQLPDPRATAGQQAPSTSNGYHSQIERRDDTMKWVQVDLGAERSLERVRLVPARPTDFADTPGFGFPLRYRVSLSSDAEFASETVLFDGTDDDQANPGASSLSFDAQGQTARYVRITATRLWPRTGDFVFALAEVEVEADGANLARNATVSALDSIEAGRWSRQALVDGSDSRQVLADASAAEIARPLLEREQCLAQIAALERERSRTQAASVPCEARQEAADLALRLAALEREQASLVAPRTYAVVSHEAREIALLERGDVEKPGEIMAPGALACLADLPHEFAATLGEGEAARRRALADWLADSRNVLTWRSIVNRVWHYHFGRGLVETTSDFGRNGARPTHPELLDWLTLWFRDGGGSLKELHRLILTSSTYRQATRHDARMAAIDGSNSYLWRMNRRRLEAEEIRDAVLAASGQLDRRVGGESFEAFHFKDDHSPRYDYVPIDRPEVYRRTIYRRITRSVPDPWLEALDCPDASQSAPVRTTTITALQALAMLNDAFMLRQSEYLAARLERETADPAERVARAFRQLFGREARPDELSAVERYAQQHGLARACRVLLNANEFVFVD